MLRCPPTSRLLTSRRPRPAPDGARAAPTKATDPDVRERYREKSAIRMRRWRERKRLEAANQAAANAAAAAAAAVAAAAAGS